jgi:hypothetical protein
MMIPLPLSGRIVSLMLTEALPFKMAGVANLMYELPENDTTEKVEDMFRALCLIEIPITNHEQNIMKIMTKRRQIVYLVQNPTDCEPSNVLTLIFSTKLIHQIYVVNTDEEYERFLRIRLSGTSNIQNSRPCCIKSTTIHLWLVFVVSFTIWPFILCILQPRL